MKANLANAPFAPWGALSLVVFNRLCDTGSKLGVLRWLETTAQQNHG